MAAPAGAALAGFLARQRRGYGRVRLKLAMSLDGRTAMAGGDSQWITGPAARRDVQDLRAQSCAIVTGIGTVLADDCALTVREDELPAGRLLPPAARRALRVVLDSRLRISPQARVLQGEQPALLLHAPEAHAPGPLAGRQRAAIAGAAGGLDLAAVLRELGRRECNEILVESGPRLAGALLAAGLVDQLLIYVAPKLLGSTARPLLELPLERMDQALGLTLREERRIGADWRFTFEPPAAC
jgi:diaminohydroxyphosphoribosylaminopyrimidine deaminase/5-amino-6-(5-phosphoribosylamino)uracil reductase